MALKRMLLGGQMVAIDDQTGELAVADQALQTRPLAISRVSVDGVSKTLPTLLGVDLNTGLSKLTLVPAGSGIFWALGEAAASGGPWLPDGGAELAIDKATADTLQFVTAGGTIDMLVIQEGR